MEWGIKELAIICPLVFLAGFVDAIAGGGGLISLPAHLTSVCHSATGTGTFAYSGCWRRSHFLRCRKVVLTFACAHFLPPFFGG